MLLAPSTSFTITAHQPLAPGSTVRRTASVHHDTIGGTWSAASPGGSMGWVTRPLDAARGVALLQRTNAFLSDAPTRVPVAAPGAPFIEVTTPATGTHVYAVDTLLAQQLLRDVFAATGRAQQHGPVVRHH